MYGQDCRKEFEFISMRPNWSVTRVSRLELHMGGPVRFSDPGGEGWYLAIRSLSEGLVTTGREGECTTPVLPS